jgi:hypothetical protein
MDEPFFATIAELIAHLKSEKIISKCVTEDAAFSRYPAMPFNYYSAAYFEEMDVK